MNPGVSIGKDEEFMLSVQVPVTTLCPCSKEISSGGAHNQRAEVTLNVRFKGFIWLEDMIEMVSPLHQARFMPC